MISNAALAAAKAAYDIEAACIQEMKAYIDDIAFSKAVELLSNAPRIGAAGSGHSGIICQHFAHLMCCIERPARFISPAEAVHGATGFLQKGDCFVGIFCGNLFCFFCDFTGFISFADMAAIGFTADMTADD